MKAKLSAMRCRCDVSTVCSSYEGLEGEVEGVHDVVDGCCLVGAVEFDAGGCEGDGGGFVGAVGSCDGGFELFAGFFGAAAGSAEVALKLGDFG